METMEKTLGKAGEVKNASTNKHFFAFSEKMDGVFSSFKVRLALFIIVDIIFLFNVFYVLSNNFDFSLSSIFGGSESTVTNESVSETLANADEAFGEISNIMVLGDYMTSDGKKFNFKSDGTFNGFFDAKNPEVDAAYTVKTENNQNTVTITYKNKSVSYTLTYDSESNYNNMLTDKSGKKIVLYAA